MAVHAPCRTIILTRAFHPWAALALRGKLPIPAECSDTKTRCVALEESIHALELQRYISVPSVESLTCSAASAAMNSQLPQYAFAENTKRTQSMHTAFAQFLLHDERPPIGLDTASAEDV